MKFIRYIKKKGWMKFNLVKLSEIQINFVELSLVLLNSVNFLEIQWNLVE